MPTFESRPEFLSALDRNLRQAHELGNPYTHKFHPRRARLEIESLEAPVEFGFYKEDWRRVFVPRLAGELAVVAFLPQDDDRELFWDYLVVEKKGRHFGTPVDNFIMPQLAARFDMDRAVVPPPALEVTRPTAEELIAH